ncbi:hypothetical protein GCM10011487_33760 [Steroidobacter agaridevorans]|uniref:Uncharacterized protein n=1 Tax=Steroidobacter agaridevorans TaxID=2695856 RepID=A0A829YFL2_9GAMM|nr:hypothetical protein [Steroidobacter agaridevorans]GFE81376.1 hypothetical protein GCM10011487_33760 [Steroidobacter agaridevorans]
MWRNFRILVLLLILLVVALNTYFDRVYSTDWNSPLYVTLYPIDGDGSPVTQQFIGDLKPDRFQALENFFQEEASFWELPLQRPIQFKSAPQLHEVPPALDRDANVFSILWWSLRMRYWVWRSPDPPGFAPDIKLFVVYHDPALTPTLAHSIGMQKGLYGVVNVFADRTMTGSNDMITAHELLHTLGATDKYDPRTSQPIHPIGYAEPTKEPLLPQTHAELMGGRIPLSNEESVTPESLNQVVIGELTAAEIRWLKK